MSQEECELYPVPSLAAAVPARDGPKREGQRAWYQPGETYQTDEEGHNVKLTCGVNLEGIAACSSSDDDDIVSGMVVTGHVNLLPGTTVASVDNDQVTLSAAPTEEIGEGTSLTFTDRLVVDAGLCTEYRFVAAATEHACERFESSNTYTPQCSCQQDDGCQETCALKSGQSGYLEATLVGTDFSGEDSGRNLIITVDGVAQTIPLTTDIDSVDAAIEALERLTGVTVAVGSEATKIKITSTSVGSSSSIAIDGDTEATGLFAEPTTAEGVAGSDACAEGSSELCEFQATCEIEASDEADCEFRVRTGYTWSTDDPVIGYCTNPSGVVNRRLTNRDACTKERVAYGGTDSVWDAAEEKCTITKDYDWETDCKTPKYSSPITPSGSATYRSWDGDKTICVEYPAVQASDPDTCVGYRYASYRTTNAVAAAETSGICQAGIDGTCYRNNHQCHPSTVCRPGYEKIRKAASGGGGDQGQGVDSDCTASLQATARFVGTTEVTVHGSVTFTQVPDGSTYDCSTASLCTPTEISLSLWGLQHGALSWKVHDAPLSSHSTCTDVAGSPVLGSSGSTLITDDEMDPAREDSDFGDLSSRTGSQLNAGANNQNNITYHFSTGTGGLRPFTAAFLPLLGPRNVLGRSLVLYKSDGAVFTCAQITGNMATVTRDYVLESQPVHRAQFGDQESFCATIGDNACDAGLSKEACEEGGCEHISHAPEEVEIRKQQKITWSPESGGLCLEEVPDKKDPPNQLYRCDSRALPCGPNDPETDQCSETNECGIGADTCECCCAVYGAFTCEMEPNDNSWIPAGNEEETGRCEISGVDSEESCQRQVNTGFGVFKGLAAPPTPLTGSWTDEQECVLTTRDGGGVKDRYETCPTSLA
eukprot:SAG31_NODE_1_length_62978_cov_30.836130_26_plen_878_part_00